MLMLALFLQSSIGTIKIPDIGVSWFDKILHFIVFGILGLLTARGFRHSTGTRMRDRFMSWSIIICILYGASDEIHQLWIPGRFASFWDWIADILGIITFILIYISKTKRMDKKDNDISP
jgi:VanZ family protein